MPLPLTHSSLHSRLGRRLRRAGDLVQRCRVRQCVGLGRHQLEPQQLLRTVARRAGFLVPQLGCLVHYFCAGCYHLPPLDSPAGDQRGSWVSSCSGYGKVDVNTCAERALVVADRVCRLGGSHCGDGRPCGR